MKKKFGLVGFITVFAILLISLSSFVALAQYETQQTADVTIPASVSLKVDQSSTVGGVSIVICGICGATGSVSTATYNGNPQPGASVPAGVTLSDFVAVTFNMSASDFQSANITIPYTSSDVLGISLPYKLYKYNADSNSYTALNCVVNTSAKTITATVTSTTDPLLAIGGTTATTKTTTVQPWVWAILATVSIMIVLLAILILRRSKSSLIIVS